MKNVIRTLMDRGFIDAMTSDELEKLVETPLKVYCGFDPTADSLHLGNLVAIMGLAWFQKAGHTPVAIMGGATGMIGDPSGRNSERQLLSEETIQVNLRGIQKNLEQILRFDVINKPVILNNYDWYKGFSFLDFLRDIGKMFRVGVMLAKDSVKSRLTSEEGMSFTEFSYQVLQGYDFLYLYNNHQVTVQLGGSDQWGNITAGTDLIRKSTGKPSYGITFPLITRSDGQKFGKSESGAIWLSAERLSPFEFYQYLVRVADSDVIKLLKMLTFMDVADIERLQKSMTEVGYKPNTVQRRLAEEVTRIVHGEEGLQKALKVTAVAAPGADAVLDVESLELISKDMPSYEITLAEVLGMKLIDLMVATGLQKSKGDARKLIKNGGVYLNNASVSDENGTVLKENLIGERLLLLAVGKKNKCIVRVKS